MKRKITYSLIVVFLSGLIIGFIAGQYSFHLRLQQIMRKGPQGFEQLFLRQLTRKLNVRPEQLPSIEQKLKETVTLIEARRQESLKELDAVLNGMLDDLLPYLDADQQALLKSMDAKDFRPKHPPPPGLRDGPPDGGQAPGQDRAG